VINPVFRVLTAKINAVRFYADVGKIKSDRRYTLTKTELISVVSGKAGIPKAAAEKAINAMTAAVTQALSKGDKVTLVGFGTFDVAQRAARTGVNPRTRAVIRIKASKSPRFRAGKAFKEAVNKR
jgi:DNA-binding protein HU-beta